ncbi:transporter [Halosegnis sp.]|uniref:transporter n=1 Tax=Halosegnis sp. TaxID=2864959 RepID=UPI0035D46C42
MSNNSISGAGRFGVAAAAGAAAWVVGYLVMYLAAADRIRESLLAPVFQAANIEVWQAIGWLFFNAHFVSTTVELGLFGTGVVNAVGGDDGFTSLLYLLAPVLLTAAGGVVGRVTDAAEMDAANAALAGAATVFGYGVLSVVGLLAVTTPNVAPDPVTAVVLAGVLYPVTFGVAGAVLARL